MWNPFACLTHALRRGYPGVLEDDLVHADLGEPLAVTLFLPVALPALPLEYDDFLVPAVSKDLRGHARATHQRRAHRNLVAVPREQDLVECDALTRVRR